MKNIHILPTDKPSKLVKDKYGDLWFNPMISCKSGWAYPQHIYITSDEEIKAGEYQLYNPLGNFDNVKVSKAERLLQNDGRRKKIILTTDQDLIKDGVQSIDDEFLEWFVKNPSCEYVEVIYGLYNLIGRKVSSEKVSENHSQCVWKYKIIIPKEEPKSLMEKLKPLQEQWQRDMLKTLQEPKQETLEEAAEKYVNINVAKNAAKLMYKEHFIQGAKWQQERMYREEEVYNLIQAGYSFCEKGKNREDVKKWFEQFKKK